MNDKRYYKKAALKDIFTGQIIFILNASIVINIGIVMDYRGSNYFPTKWLYQHIYPSDYYWVLK